MHHPIRTCVGCQQHDRQDNMLRVVFAQQRLLVDPGRRMPGRGAYVHPRLSCVEGNITQGFSRSFRTRIAATQAAQFHSGVAPMISSAGGQSQ